MSPVLLLSQQNRLECHSGVTQTAVRCLATYLACNTTTTLSTSWCQRWLMSIYYERELLSLLQVSTFDVSVVCRNVKCLHYILATGLVFFRIVCAGHVYTQFKDYIMTFSVLPYLTPTLLKQLITEKTLDEYLLCTGSTHRMKAGFLSVHVSGIHIRTSCRSGLACGFFIWCCRILPRMSGMIWGQLCRIT